MAPAPLPPHERSWRHPSELASASVVVDDAGSGGRGLAIASGALAAVMVAVLVVSITPRRSSAPTALSATTLPAFSVLPGADDSAAAAAPAPARRGVVGSAGTDASVKLRHRSVMRDGGSVSLSGAPIVVSAAPVGSALDAATTEPADTDRVVVLTMSHTYDVAWGDVDRLSAPDGSVVITRDGELLGVFVDGRLEPVL